MGSRLGVEKKNTRKRQRENRTEVEKASRGKLPKGCRGRGARVCLLELSARVFSFSLTFASSAFFNVKSFAAPPLRTATRKRQRGPFSPVRVCVCERSRVHSRGGREYKSNWPVREIFDTADRRGSS